MKTTIEELKREDIKKIFLRRLGANMIKLEAVNINVAESVSSDFTETNISFLEKEGDSSKVVCANETRAKGFLDGIFKSLYEKYVSEYHSLSNIKLINLSVSPLMSSAIKSIGTDAKTSVTVVSEIENYGYVNFSSTSRSLVYSSFCASLSTFEFYINCEKCFYLLLKVLEDAKRRSREDVAQECIRDMSFLTSVNRYEKGKKV